jgi:hypothetical protein
MFPEYADRLGRRGEGGIGFKGIAGQRFSVPCSLFPVLPAAVELEALKLFSENRELIADNCFTGTRKPDEGLIQCRELERS